MDEHDADRSDVMDRALRLGRLAVSVLVAVVVPLRGWWAEPMPAAVAFAAVAIVAAVAATDLIALRSTDATQPTGRSLLLDVVVALLLIGVLDATSTPIAWAALVLPVADAAVRLGVGAAVEMWGVLAGFYLMLRYTADPTMDAEELVLAAQQLFAVALLGVPAAVVGRVVSARIDRVEQDRRTARSAVETLTRMADASRTLTGAPRPDDVLDGAMAAARALGYVRVDLVVPTDDGWRHRLVSMPPGVPVIPPELGADQAVRRGTSPVEAGGSLVFHAAGVRGGTAVRIGATSYVLRLWADRDRHGAEGEQERIGLLARQLASAWEAATAREELAQQAEDFERKATRDALTGLVNRSGLSQLLDGMAIGSGATVAVLFFDLDGFKAINDTHGHDAGDAVLATTAQRLRARVPDGATPVRLGGDEFVVVAPGLARAAATRLGEELIEAVSEPIVLDDGPEVRVGTSVGVALAERGDTADGLVQRADAAMYEVKRAGGGQVIVGALSAT